MTIKNQRKLLDPSFAKALKDVFLAREELLKYNPPDREKIQKSQDRMQRLLSKDQEAQNSNDIRPERKTIFKPLSTERLAQHQKPLSGNPGVPLKE
jgi:hypothetical protein